MPLNCRRSFDRPSWYENVKLFLSLMFQSFRHEKICFFDGVSANEMYGATRMLFAPEFDATASSGRVGAGSPKFGLVVQRDVDIDDRIFLDLVVFVRSEKEELVFDDRPAESEARIVIREFRAFDAAAVVVPGVRVQARRRGNRRTPGRGNCCCRRGCGG